MNWALDLFVLVFAILILYKARFVSPLSSFNTDSYLSKETGISIRGVFAASIVLSHLSNNTNGGVLFHKFSVIGAFAVAVFFFLSGYGLQKSYMFQKERYTRSFLKKRLKSIIIPYLIMIIVYWIISYVGGQNYKMNDIIDSFINGKPVVMFSWYIISILLFYFYYWILMKTCKEKYKLMLLLAALWCVLNFIFCYKMNYDSHWYTSNQLLVIGMAWAVYEDRILQLFKKNYARIAIILFVLFVLVFEVNKYINNSVINLTLSIVSPVLFVLCLLVCLLKVHVGNTFSTFLGRISLELYMTHGLFFLLFRGNRIYINNEFLWSVSVLFGSIISAYLLHIAFNRIKKRNDLK